MKMTQQRRAILEALEGDKSHPSAEQVFRKIKRRMPTISLGTVYRNLVALADQGVIQKVGESGGMMRFDWNPADHAHLRCVSCGRIDDLCGRPEISLKRLPDVIGGFKVRSARIEVIGLCPNCAAGVKESEVEGSGSKGGSTVRAAGARPGALSAKSKAKARKSGGDERN